METRSSRRATLIAEREIITMSRTRCRVRVHEDREKTKFQRRHLITIYSDDIYDRRELSEFIAIARGSLRCPIGGCKT